MTPLVLLESTGETPVARLLRALGVVFETRSLMQALADSLETSRALILSEEQLANVHGISANPPMPLKTLFSQYRQILIYPFRGTADGLRALSAFVEGRAEVGSLHAGHESRYSVASDFAAVGPFAGLEVGPANRTTDCGLLIRESPYAVKNIASIGDDGLFTRITFPSGELFVLSTTAVFDVEADAVKNLDVVKCFSALVPLLFFLRHSQAAFWQTSYAAANVIIDDLNLRPSYGFVNARTLARYVDELACAVSIGFIPWNCNRTSRKVVDLFRSRWPRLSLCVHGCDHMGAEFSTDSVSATRPMIGSSLDRMRSLNIRTGVRYDKVMVFPQGRFSHTAMEALRQSDFLAAVNTELVDHRTQRGVRAGELLRPAITSYGGFPLFLRRKLDEPIANFALDLLLGKPCLVVTHHDDFRGGMQPFVSLVDSLKALDPALQWTNLETIIARTYATRPSSASALDVRLFASSTALGPQDAAGEICFSKAEPLADNDFEVLVAGQSVKGHREDDDIVFRQAIAARLPTPIDVRMSPPDLVPLTIRPLSYRGKVAARRYLSEFRDNYVARSSWATAAVRFVRGSQLTVEPR
jgi:hypothetical protein